jgi:peptidoglycan hydrolase-like protein with peptidoglycan-binding domain
MSFSWSGIPNTGYCAGQHIVNGGAVVGAQTALVAKGYYLDPRYPVDGLFGPVSTAATVLFQRANFIAVDGCIGPQTWSYLQAGMIRLASPNAYETYYLEGTTCCHVWYGYGRFFDSDPNQDPVNDCLWTITLDDDTEPRPYTSGPPALAYRHQHVRMRQRGPLYWTLSEPLGAC